MKTDLLGHEAHQPPGRLALPGGVVATKEDRALIGNHPQQTAQGCRLAGPIFAPKGHRLAFLDFEREIIYGRDRPESLAQISYSYHSLTPLFRQRTEILLPAWPTPKFRAFERAQHQQHRR